MWSQMISRGVHLLTCLGRKRKRRTDCVQGGARRKENREREDLNQMDQSVESKDLISLLPDHVIHHILSLLRNVSHAARTSVLSKRWKALWESFSVLIFDERKFAAGIGDEEDSCNKEEMFRDYVSETLNTCLEENLFKQKLVLRMTTFDSEEDTPLVDHWLSVALTKNIKEIDLHVRQEENSEPYTLPQTVFSSKTLTVLRLRGCKLKTCDNVMLPRLQKLCIWKTRLVDSLVEDLISSCSSIEDLRFIQCSGLRFLHVSTLLELNRVEIHHCCQLRKVEINAPKLHTFWLRGSKTTPCKVSLEGCTLLKRLTLEHPQVTRDFCENHISNFPYLEKLDLKISKTMKFMNITTPQLQKFVLRGGKKLGSALVDAPNLVSFEYKGDGLPWVQFYPIPFSLTDAKLSFEFKPKPQVVGIGDKFWAVIKQFMTSFNPKEFKLVIHSGKFIIIHEDLENVSFPPLCDVTFEFVKSSACFDDILYNLMRTSHPVSLSIVSSSDSQFNKEETAGRKKSLIVGPWGGNGGNSWDDGSFNGVREIKLVYDHCIDSIQVTYDKNGKPFTAEKHGGNGGSKTAEIKLQYPNEYLIGVSGHYHPVVRGMTPVIRSLTFKTNKRTLGSYGIEEGTPFTFSIEGGQVVGFKGKADWYLDQIAFTLSSVPSKSLFHKVQRSFSRLTSIAPNKSSSSKNA